MPEKLKVEFEYALGDKVKDPFGNMGIVKMCGIDTEGVVYSVMMEKDWRWYRDFDLQPWV